MADEANDYKGAAVERGNDGEGKAPLSQQAAPAQEPANPQPERSLEQVASDFLGGSGNMTGEQAGEILSRASSDKEFAALPEVQKFISYANDFAKKKGMSGEGGEGTGDQGAGEKKKAPDAPYKEGAEEPKGQERGEDQFQSKFFKNTGDDAEITKENIPQYIKEKFSIDAESNEGVSKFFTSVDKWRNDSQKLSTTSRELNAIKEELQSLPPEILTAIQAFENNEDFRKVLTRAPVDYSKPFSAQEPKQMLKHYFPNDFTDDDLEDLSDPSIRRSLSAAQAKYEAEQNEFRLQTKRVSDRSDARKRALKESTDGSVSTLRTKYPGLDDVIVNKVEDLLSGNRIMELFLNEDGTYKEEAAVRLAMALSGEDELKQAHSYISKLRKTTGNLKKVDSSSKTVKSGGSQGGEGDAGRTKVPSGAMSFLKSMQPQRTYG